MNHDNIFSILILSYAFFVTHAHNDSTSDRQARALLYPSLTDLQITICTVSNIFSHQFGRGASNLGFQFNYRLPWRLENFYRPMYWARTASDILMNRISDASESEQLGRYNYDATGITAGQLYKALKQFLLAMDFHPDCLAKSICELAHTPFDSEEEHLLQEVIHFLLTPSEHQSFHRNERTMRKRYQAAEKAGRNRMDCDRIYPKCPESALSLFSAIVQS
ncbi:uncharacterized protein LOC135712140 [Ochlerotatus camptorhynchus]|uniref:uncharacterized protein LOC135712140 n=1 Tax=Ochlerotatus camptorhynchus TaxID=644619 RepID=UPI0031DF2C55